VVTHCGFFQSFRTVILHILFAFTHIFFDSSIILRIARMGKDDSRDKVAGFGFCALHTCANYDREVFFPQMCLIPIGSQWFISHI
jgi:hypothetical protein